MTEGGIAVGPNHAIKQKLRGGWLSESDVILLYSARIGGRWPTVTLI
jgi:hypothetical protein